MFQTIFTSVRKACPLVHNTTSYVTVNDCADMLLTYGTSPITADDEEEVEEITALCAGLNINIGALNRRTIASMLLAGKRANVLRRPAALNPIGTDTSELRTETAERLLKEVKFTVIRDNISEIKTLTYGNGTTDGVDAGIADRVTDGNPPGMVAFAKAFTAKTGAVIAITSAIDIAADSSRAHCVRNEHPVMTSIAGVGCQLSVVTTALVATNGEQALEATAAAIAAMGYAEELAYERHSATDGSATYRNDIIDTVHNMTPETLERGVRYKVC